MVSELTEAFWTRGTPIYINFFLKGGMIVGNFQLPQKDTKMAVVKTFFTLKDTHQNTHLNFFRKT